MAKKEQMPMSRLIEYENASAKLSIEEKVGQFFMPAAFINDTEEEIQAIERLIAEHKVGGLCFFHSRASAATNYEGEKEIIYNEQSFNTLKNLIQRYQRISAYRLLIAIDAEWGLAMRVENTPQYPYAITLGAMQEQYDLTYEVGKNIAHDCKQAGIHYNLSPVLDINNNPKNPVIGYRSFGEDKNKVTQHGIAYTKGMQDQGVLGSIKHFPGHGDTATDSHLGLPVILKSKEDLLNNELFPFMELVKEGVDSVMVGHLSIPALSNGKSDPSSLSKEMITGLLREEIGFKGVVISDALNMHAVSKHHPTKGELEWLAFDAGNDILCFAEHTKEGIETIINNASLEQIESAFERIWRLKEKGIKFEASHKVELIDPDELNRSIAQKSITRLGELKNSISNVLGTSFVGITNQKADDNYFFSNIQKRSSFSQFTFTTNSTTAIEKQMGADPKILLALFPTKVSPKDAFGFNKQEVEWINSLLHNQDVVLYLFGNPFALGLFDYENAVSVIVAYQDFKVFQEVAALHFFGEIEAIGKLPVKIK